MLQSIMDNPETQATADIRYNEDKLTKYSDTCDL